MEIIPLEVLVEDITIPLEAVTGDDEIALDIEHVREVYRDLPDYEGPYTVTPSAESQTLLTDNKRMAGDIVIEAIPQNYGKVSYNGSILTIT